MMRAAIKKPYWPTKKLNEAQVQDGPRNPEYRRLIFQSQSPLAI